MLQTVSSGWTKTEADRMLRRSVNKKHWNDQAQEWQDFVLWTVPHTRERENWLRKTYGERTTTPGPNTWSIGVHTLILGESVYLMMCLQLD
jgi:hypothetical protein